MHKIVESAVQTASFAQLYKELKQKGNTVYLNELVGGALSFYLAAAVSKTAGLHIVVAEDRDAAAYTMNDLYALVGEKRVLFFPSAYKRSIVYGREDAEGVVMRTNVMNEIANLKSDDFLIVCTYPEAIAEAVVAQNELEKQSVKIAKGDRLDISDLVDELENQGFVRVDFVYEPGQYSVRGGIVDVFSYSESRPYRLDFFGDEVESLRRFEIGNQLSSDALESIDIIGNINRAEGRNVSFASFVGEGANYWFYDADYVFRRVDDIRVKVLEQSEEPQSAVEKMSSRRAFVADMAGSTVLMLKNNLTERPCRATVIFHTQPQSSFGKNFEMLADDMTRRRGEGLQCYVLSDNLAQMERLENIFHSINRHDIAPQMMRLLLHEGFVD